MKLNRDLKMMKSHQKKITFVVMKYLMLVAALTMLFGTVSTMAADSPLLHNSNRFSAPSKWGANGWGITGGEYGEFTCKTCHGKKTGNIKRVLKNVAVTDPGAIANGAIFPIQADVGQQVIFLDTRNGTADFGDDSAAERPDPSKSDKICEACHSRTKYHNYDTANNTLADGVTPAADPDHYNSQDCISCHQHKNGFTASCDNCHYADKQLADSHPIHFNTSTLAVGNFNSITSTQTEYIFQCGNCHEAASTIHIDGDVIEGVQSAEIAISGGGTYNNGATVNVQVGPDSNNYEYTDGTCSNLYCHGDGNGGVGNVNPQWTTSTMTCSSCHDEATGLVTGAHEAHVNNGAIMTDKSCETCHTVTTTDGSSIADKRLHVNKTKDVNIAATYNLASSFSFTQGTDTCSNTYCHSDGQGGNNNVNWGDTIGNCTFCHDGASAGTGLSGAHESHIFNSADFGRDLTCNECHETTASDNVTINDPSVHVDKLKTLNIANFGNAQSDCTTSDCHSDGNYDSATDSGQGQQFNNPDWATGSLDCDDCHGNQAGVVYPVYNTVLGVATGDRNSHYKHVNDGNMDCGECHYDTSKTGTSLDGADAQVHVNRTVDVVFNTSGLNASATWTDGSNSCATTYCHGGATPEWGGVVNCGSCHEVNKNLPPSHATHYNAIAQGDQTVATNNSSGTDYIFECGSCHDSVPHADGSTDVNFNTVYGGSFNGSDQCSNVYCHSDGNGGAGNQTPTWNSALPGLATCSSCHDQQPATFKHTVHVDDAKYDFNCTECHRDTTLDGSSIVETAKHVNKVKDVVYNTLNNASTYVDAETDCSNLYCHSDGQGGAPLVTNIKWNSATTLNCQGCHDGATNNTALSGAHEAHIFNSADFGRDLTCNECHDTTADNNTTLDAATGYANHVDGLNSVTVTNFGTPRSDCSNVQCHSDGNYDSTGVGGEQGLVFNNPAPDWNNDTFGCVDCHGDGSNAYPTYNTVELGNTTYTDRNSHYQHVVNNGNSCEECHQETSTAGIAIDGTAAATAHVNNIVNVALLQGGSWNDGTNTCSTTYCHDSGTPQWGGVVNCGDCHADDKTLPATHDIHFNTTTLAADRTRAGYNSTTTEYIFQCGSCHDNQPHADGNLTVVFNAAQVGGSFTGGTDCSSVYCHSDGASGAGNAYRTPTWNSALAGMSDCTACHNNNDSVNGKTMASGKHTAHVNSATIMANIGCVECHDATVSDDRTIVDNTMHVNNNKDVLLSDTYNTGVFSYTDGTDNCSATYCHSDGKATPTTDTVNWESDSSTGCNFCHGDAGNGVGGAGTALSGPHNVHTNSATFAYSCEACHTQTVADSSTIDTLSNHINQSVEVFVNVSTFGGDGTDFSGAGGSCATTDCHGTGDAAVTWASLPAGQQTGDCSLCHGMAADTTDGRDTAGDTANTDVEVGAHVAHLSTTYNISSVIACNECHVDPNDTAGTYYDKVKTANHMNGSTEVPLNGSLATNSATITPVYTGGGTGTCATTYCHDGAQIGNGWDGADDKTPVWYNALYLDRDNDGFLAVDDCNNCHGYPPAGTHTTNTNCDSCHNNVINLPDDATANIFADVSLHIDGIVQAEGGDDCTSCHTAGSLSSRHDNHTDYATLLSGKTLSGNDYGNTAWWYNIATVNGETKMACGQCHWQADPSNHPNNTFDLVLYNTADTPANNIKQLNLASAAYNGSTTVVTDVYVQANEDAGSCSNVYCHSDGNADGGYGYVESPKWYNTATAGNGAAANFVGNKCDDCHGNSPTTGTHGDHAVGIHYRTLYNGTTGLLAEAAATGAAHGDANTSTVVGCQTCHSDTVRVTANDTNNVCATCHSGSPQGVMTIWSSSTKHIDGTPNVVFNIANLKSKAQVRGDIETIAELGDNWNRVETYKNAAGLGYDLGQLPATPSYNATNDNCSNINCHNGRTTPTWSGGFNFDCASCHTRVPQ